ncbi:MAG: sugar ABC transporter permease [Geminicoccaceae bacterium]
MATSAKAPAYERPEESWLSKLFDNKAFLIFICMLPAVGLLTIFLSYPLGLGIWLAFTDTRIGRPGIFVGLENYAWLWDDPIFWMSVGNTLLYTIVATIGKFALGLWLALLLNHHLPFKSLLRAIILIPWIVPTVLSAIAFWWIYDPQFSIISYVLVDKLSVMDNYINFLGDPGTPAGR